MKRITFLLFLCIFQLSFSQQKDLIEVNIEATVLDYETNIGIPFSEVKFIAKNIGVLTDKNGNFSLNYFDQDINNDDIFIITAYGYDTIKTNSKSLYKFLNNTNKFFLKKSLESNQWFDENDASDNYLYGKVFTGKGPIQGASIKVKNSLIESKSDFEGFFKIKADINDVLSVNYLGMIEKQLLVENLDDKYILLKTDAQILDEVTITGNKDSSDNIDTGYGKRNNPRD